MFPSVRLKNFNSGGNQKKKKKKKEIVLYYFSHIFYVDYAMYMTVLYFHYCIVLYTKEKLYLCNIASILKPL